MSTDRISNLLSSVKNAAMAGKSSLEFGHFKQGQEVLEILKTRGLVKDVKVFKIKDKVYKGLHVDLVDLNGTTRRLEVERVSKPGRRVYGQYEKLLKVKSGMGVLVVSTSRGMLSGEEAKKRKLGGELICKVYFE